MDDWGKGIWNWKPGIVAVSYRDGRLTNVEWRCLQGARERQTCGDGIMLICIQVLFHWVPYSQEEARSLQ
jgi:hypothetical protein